MTAGLGFVVGAAGRYADARDWVVASFLQHDSRDHDPQLHVHNAILNRVENPNGKWRTLATRAIYTHRPAAGALAERVMEGPLPRERTQAHTGLRPVPLSAAPRNPIP